MGAWDEAAGEEIRAELEEGQALGSASRQGSTETPGSTLPGGPRGVMSRAFPSPTHPSVCASYTRACPTFPFLYKGLLFHLLVLLASSEAGATPCRGVSHLWKVWGVGAGVLGGEKEGAGRQSSPPRPRSPRLRAVSQCGSVVGLCSEE